MSFGPKNKKEEPIFAAETLCFQMQHQIRTLMNKAGVNQSELSRRSGISQSSISVLLSDKGRTNFSLGMMIKIFSALGHEINIKIEPAVMFELKK